jgi:hypothetical protein
MQVLTIDNLWLEFQSAGRLLPWLGPALRGILLRRLKEEVCQQPKPQQNTVWKYCRGCPFMGDCRYGELFEPDHLDWAVNKLEPDLVRLLNGRKEPPRPIILVPAYPAPEEADSGLMLPLSIRFFGKQAAAHVDWVLDRLDQAGRSGVLGQNNVRFRLDFREVRESRVELTPEMLPTSIDPTAGVIPRLGIGLTAPLFLAPAVKTTRTSAIRKRPRSRAETSQQNLIVPSFEELFRAALNNVRAQLTAAGEPPPRLDLRMWGRAARNVALQEHCYEEFTQPHWQSRHCDDAFGSPLPSQRCEVGQYDRRRATRSGSREFQGTFGGGVYTHVPWSFLPWLTWAGLFHVGGERVSGAGGWRVLLNP